MNSLDRMKKRLMYDGGPTQDDRNVKGKWYSFRSALRNSYQAEDITFNGERCRCLINPDKLKEDYDQKEISIDFKYGMQNGSVFYWDRTNTYWLVYLQDYNEEAYFRASIRRCDYEIDVNDHRYHIYLRKPNEAEIIWRQKYQTEFNELNYSLLFYIEKNEETLAFFERFKKIKFDGHNWRVAATDKYTQNGIIEVYLEEYFDNEMEDAMVEPEIIEPDLMHPYIEGPQFVRPYDTNIAYTIVGVSGGGFLVNSNKVDFIEADDKTCKIEILTGKSLSFTLIYHRDGEEDITLDVTVKSF